MNIGQLTLTNEGMSFRVLAVDVTTEPMRVQALFAHDGSSAWIDAPTFYSGQMLKTTKGSEVHVIVVRPGRQNLLLVEVENGDYAEVNKFGCFDNEDLSEKFGDVLLPTPTDTYTERDVVDRRTHWVGDTLPTSKGTSVTINEIAPHDMDNHLKVTWPDGKTSWIDATGEGPMWSGIDFGYVKIQAAPVMVA